MIWHSIEEEAFQREIQLAGIDEAGRGPLAGPVVVAAVILPSDVPVEILDDSKKVTPKNREAAYEIICQRAIARHSVVVDAEIVDQINILQATLKGMRESVEGLAFLPDKIVVDGNRDRRLPSHWECYVGGDQLFAAIAAASIVAKVERDRLMEEYGALYPEYGFEKNKGYGAKVHLEALKQIGPCPIHRRTFNPLRTWLEEMTLF